MEKEQTVRNQISSITVVEPLPRLIIKLSKTDGGATPILVDGMTRSVAQEIPWGPILDFLGKVAGALLDGAAKSGSGSGNGCTTITIKNPDGSSTTITQCPPTPQ
jgi:hypothetical protein